jgi:myo-inositol-1(or 4)-monophosphatase
MTELPDAWSAFAKEVVQSLNHEYARLKSWDVWTKVSDGSLVSSLDVNFDVVIRGVVARHYPGLPVLSEELGWLTSNGAISSVFAGVLDPIDGTESLLLGRQSWWTSFGICKGGQPLAGLIHQPVRGITHDSRMPRLRSRHSRCVGLSPDQVERLETQEITAKLAKINSAIVPVPHAVEKVAAVLEGRCAACIYLPSSKSPSWQSWDLAACIALAQANGLRLLDLDGEPIRFTDLDSSRHDAWICARDDESWASTRDALP